MQAADRPGAARLRAMEDRPRPGSVVHEIVDVPADMSSAEFAAAEQVVEQGQRTFVEVGQALLAIRDGRGYRHAGHATFEAYLYERWGWSRGHGYRLIDAATVAVELENVSPGIHLPSERHARELVPLAPAERAAIIEALPKPLTEYSTRELRQTIKDRRVERVRDARATLLAVAPAVSDAAIYQADAARIHEHDFTPYRDVDLIVTSPPYGLGLDGSDQAQDLDWERYLADADDWAHAMYEVAHHDHGRLCLNVPVDRTKGSREPVYADWVQVLRRQDWHYESTIVWKEGNVSNHQARGSVASPNAPHAVAPVETIIVMYRGEWNRGAPRRASDIRELDWVDWLSSTWNFAGEHRYRVGHNAPFPEELPRRLIQLFSFPGDLVADPFLGSGTTALVALQLGRRFVGSDIDSECVQLARARVAQASPA